MLDIIIPHYNEPWSVGQQLFDMLGVQRGIDFDQIHVILVNDGFEHKLPDVYFSDRPYHVEQISIPHGGVSVARNAGLEAATHEWVMFCDFDDVFSNIYSMRDYMTPLPAKDYDVLWGDFYVEDKNEQDALRIITRTDLNTVFVHSKLFRREFLLDKNIRFTPGLTFDEDGEFNSIVFAVAERKRVGKIVTKTPPYVWCWRKDSTTHGYNDRREEGAICHYKRNKNVCEVYKKVLPMNRVCGMVARTVWDMYYTLNVPTLSDKMVEMRNDFIQWFAKHKEYYLEADRQDIPLIRRIARIERKTEDFRDNVTIEQWLDEIEKEM